ncbi:ADP-ribose diphosphatase [Weizmannia acidilactici]|uniref:ADP-ribose diphosphatase n=1 Tax=Weizmannia acidilactici TaxID=2607726 RepID=A0A5J4J2S7_9BACI|nr:NUDIX hydrolase [Weizmannia acidilactici]GER66089.1 ADP-ribose diphosphatase [Weizmannia acidilactici]GER69276.1 ADP-ribose diphosphatase [Weizmannia acidilactici]GER72398.1 ADP-ribose diphosphatase [Weizmannia acidilactici]
MHKYEEKTLKVEEIFNGKILHLQVLDVELSDGKTSKREVIKHPGAVAVLAVTKENKVVMVEQYRKAAERALIEIPAGKLEPGEDPLEAAMRELEEETGYACGKLEPITAFYTSPGFADEWIRLYMATGLEKLEEPKAGDDDEFVDILEFSLDEVKGMLRSGKLCDAKTIIALQHWILLGENK